MQKKSKMTKAMENDIIKKDLKIVERNNELMISSEKREDNNYKDFDINNKYEKNYNIEN